MGASCAPRWGAWLALAPGGASAEIRWRRSAVESSYAGHPAGPYHEVAHEFLFAPELRALRDKTRQFVAEQVIPLENDERQSHHGPSEALRDELVARARMPGCSRRTRRAIWAAWA
jgi:hypothetical protein